MKEELEWRDVSNEVEFKNGKANPFGWSQEEIWHDGKQIGWLYCGDLQIDAVGYKSEVIQETPTRCRGIISRGLPRADWEAVEYLKQVKP